MKVIFLDIDGVLNTDRAIRQRKNQNNDQIHFDEEAMKNLNEIIKTTKSKIVISSTWRIHQNTENPLWIAIIENFKRYKIDSEIISTTEKYENGSPQNPRWKEIKNWLESNKEKDITSFLILDDEWNMEDLNNNFVRCSPSIGIDRKNKEDGIKILKGKT